ncbi:MAG: glycosyltransferase family 2 protein [Capsulimonadales bacterium]|nr:glycosyltransferase family 2 protein [Capsulimonadales bacterium]
MTNAADSGIVPRVRVCIVSWNAREDLRRCLTDLKTAVADPRTLETVVVDNASADGSADMVAAEFPDVRLVRLTENTGFSGGNNTALEGLTADYAFLLNSDAFCHPGAIDRLVAFADATPEAGFIGPKVLNPDDSIQYSCRRWPTFAAGLFRNVYLGRLFPNNRPAADYLMQDFDHARTIDVDWLSGCALMVRRTCMEKVGRLDGETFFMYCEDMDWCLRGHTAGWRVVYYPEAVVTHMIGRSSDKAADRMILEHSRSMWKFFRKHEVFFRDRVPALLRPLVKPGIYLRAYVRIFRRRYINPILALLKGTDRAR